jgi:hypothetical protein
MPEIKVIHGDARDYTFSADLMLTDPPFDMPGSALADIIKRYDCRHLVLITTMRQLMELYPLLGWELAFDFVLDAVVPKKSRNVQQPNYTHCTGVYLHAPGEKSLYDRKKRQRSDVFEGNGYWPTIFHAPRQLRDEHTLAKNADTLTDILGSFKVESVIDPFAGSGTVGIASLELGISCILIEKNKKHCDTMLKKFRFFKGLEGQLYS